MAAATQLSTIRFTQVVDTCRAALGWALCPVSRPTAAEASAGARRPASGPPNVQLLIGMPIWVFSIEPLIAHLYSSAWVPAWRNPSEDYFFLFRIRFGAQLS